MGKIRIAITDDHMVFRKGLISTIEPYEDVEVVMEAESGVQLLQTYRKHEPDVFLMDIKMPGLDGIQTTRKLLDKNPKARVVALSVFDQDVYVANMFHAGAKGYLLKDADTEEIMRAIRLVHEGEFYFNDRFSKVLYKRLYLTSHPATKLTTEEDVAFSESESRILELICQEYTSLEIAQMLNMGARTVEKHRLKMITRVKARNTVGLVTYVIRRGLISLD